VAQSIGSEFKFRYQGKKCKQTKGTELTDETIHRHKIKLKKSRSLNPWFFFTLFGEIGVMSLHLQSRCSPASAMPLVHFTPVILEMGFRELFAHAGFKSQSFQPPPPN
jgi:hypothetical protein